MNGLCLYLRYTSLCIFCYQSKNCCCYEILLISQKCEQEKLFSGGSSNKDQCGFGSAAETESKVLW